MQGFVETGARWMVPMHYGTFRLGREPMEEPPVRMMAEAERLGIAGKFVCWKKARRCDFHSEDGILFGMATNTVSAKASGDVCDWRGT